jgi:putative peptidoglycan lipid II flippase
MIGGMLVGSLILSLSGGPLAQVLAWGALLGGGLQLGVQLPVALRLVGELRPSLSLDAPGVREAIRNFTPVVAARGAVNLSGYLDVFLASFLASGAIAILGYAQVLYLLPISLFALSVAAAELPELSRDRRKGADQLARELSRGMDRVTYFLIPSTVAYLAFGDLIAAALLQWGGSFGPQEARVTWVVLGAYALGMAASAQSRLLSSGFYALHDTRTPARIAYVRIGLSVLVGLGLMFPLDRVMIGGFGIGASGLALGASVGAWVEWSLLRRALRRLVGSIAPAPGRTIRVLIAAGLAGAAALGARSILSGLHPWIQLIGTLLPCGGVYLATTVAMGVAGPIRDLLPGRFGES